MDAKELYDLMKWGIGDQLTGPADDVAAARQSWAIRLGELSRVAPELAMQLEDELQRRKVKHRNWVEFWRRQRCARDEDARKLRKYWKENPLSDLQPKLLQSSPQAGRQKEACINKTGVRS